MAKNDTTALSEEQAEELISILKLRFSKNLHRHNGLDWKVVEDSLKASPEKLQTLHEMERTGGEPDIIYSGERSVKIRFVDCAAESPKGRRSLCYDPEALESRKKFPPKNSAVALADEMGAQILTEEEYRELQNFGPVDTKTSSWLKTPEEVRKLGGAIFGDYRFGRVFIYHNGADSYYGARGFRCSLEL